MKSSKLARLGLRVKDLTHRDRPSPAPGAFVWGANLGGESLEWLGQRWWSHDEALSQGLQCADVRTLNIPIIPQPHAGPALRKMLATAVFRAQTLRVEVPVPEGPHALVLWLAENWQRNWHRYSLSIDGAPVASGLGQLALGGWEACGPYAVDGAARSVAVQLDTGRAEIDAVLMGISLHRR